MPTSPAYTRPRGRRLLGNRNTTEFHDLRNEQPRCQIDRLVAAGHAVVFDPDTLDEAKRCGYDRCHYWLGGSTR